MGNKDGSARYTQRIKKGEEKMMKSINRITQKNFKREAEEVGEMIEFLKDLKQHLNDKNEEIIYDERFYLKIKQLKLKQDALILASELKK